MPVRSAAGARQTFQVNVIRKEEYRKSAEALQNELSLPPGSCSWGGREDDRKEKVREKKKRLGGLRAVAGEGTQPQSWMKQKGKHEEKHRLKNE